MEVGWAGQAAEREALEELVSEPVELLEGLGSWAPLAGGGPWEAGEETEGWGEARGAKEEGSE